MRPPDPPRGRRLSPEETGTALRDFVAAQEGVAPERVAVRELRRLAGGASRLLWSADVEIAGSGAPGEAQRRLELVLRQDPPGRIAPGAMQLEFRLLAAAAERGVPVPRVFWCAPDPGALGAPFFAMQRLRGEAIPRRLLRDEAYAGLRRDLVRRLGAILARVHAIDPGAPGLEALPHPPRGLSPAEAEIERVATGVRALAVEPHPVLDLAERWLRAHAPPPPPDGAPLSFVHGDYRLGNVLCDEGGVVAILDWELAHAGDPVEDLGWLCVRAWRFGQDALPAAGLGTREELVEAYEKAGGAPVDPAALRFWEVAGNYKLALVFISQARAYLDGAHATVELASLGRRTAEAEEELLALIDEGGGARRGEGGA